MSEIGVAELSDEIQRQIDWYEAKSRKMTDRRYVLALAVVIGAQKALRELIEDLPKIALREKRLMAKRCGIDVPADADELAINSAIARFTSNA